MEMRSKELTCTGKKLIPPDIELNFGCNSFVEVDYLNEK